MMVLIEKYRIYVRKMLSDPFWTTEQQIQTEVEG
jgi:hypothetical protein